MKNPMTPEGRRELEAELARLKSEDRPQIVRAIATARAHGDLSENAEYHSAKEKQGFIESRIAELESALSTSEVIDVAQIEFSGRCIFGAYVEVRREDESRESAIYRVVGHYEVNLTRGWISIGSPLGKSLLGKSINDSFEIEAPEGAIEYTLLRVSHEPI